MTQPQRLFHRTLSIATLVLSAAGGGRAADGGTPPAPAQNPLQLLDGTKSSISFTWRQIQSGTAVVTVYNGSAASVGVTQSTAALSPLRTRGSSGFDLTLTPATPAIPAGTSSFFVVSGPAAMPGAGDYAGLAAFKDTAGKAVLPDQTVFVAVASVPEPLVKGLAVTRWRLFPFSPLWWPDAFPVPLADPAAGARLNGATVGAVRRELGGWTTVTWDSGGGTQPSVVIGEPPTAGKYEGDLNLNPDSATKVALPLTVTAKDIILWPLLVIGAGIGVAFVAKRYTGVLRVTKVLRLQEAELGPAFRDSQARFAYLTAGQPPSKYSIAADFDRQRQLARTDLDTLEKSFTTTLDSNPIYVGVLNTLKTLENTTALWAEFGSDMAALNAAINTLTSGSDPNAIEPPPGNPEPQFLAADQQFLAGGPIAVAALPALRDDALARTNVVQRWTVSRARLVHLTADYRSLVARATPPAPAALSALQQSIVTLWANLLGVSSAADMSAVEGDPNFRASLVLAQQIRAQLGAPVPAPIPVPLTAMMMAADRLLEVHTPASDQQRAEMLRQSIRRWDQLSIWLAVVLAVLTGLKTYYFGQSFGSLVDYAGLFLWAAGTKAALDMLTTVLDRLPSLSQAVKV